MMNNETTSPQQRTSPLAIWSLALGILSVLGCVCATGIPAIILGIMALTRIKKPPSRFGGQGLAVAGLITGGIGTLLTVMMFMLTSLVMPAFVGAIVGAKSQAQQAACMNHVRQLTMACQMHAQDHDGKLPEKLEDLKPFLGTSGSDQFLKAFICSAAQDQATSSYELLNGGRQISDLDAERTVIIREKQPNHQGGRAVGYLDGHTRLSRE